MVANLPTSNQVVDALPSSEQVFLQHLFYLIFYLYPKVIEAVPADQVIDQVAKHCFLIFLKLFTGERLPPHHGPSCRAGESVDDSAEFKNAKTQNYSELEGGFET